MLKTIFSSTGGFAGTSPQEGDLYRVLQVEGKKFPIYYGFYEAYERENPAAEPMPIYPDFLAQPEYTAEGWRFVTKMQDACEHYIGSSACRECAECAYCREGEDLIGICVCPKNKGSPTISAVTDNENQQT